jgi:hypothetical protein
MVRFPKRRPHFLLEIKVLFENQFGQKITLLDVRPETIAVDRMGNPYFARFIELDIDGMRGLMTLDQKLIDIGGGDFVVREIMDFAKAALS